MPDIAPKLADTTEAACNARVKSVGTGAFDVDVSHKREKTPLLNASTRRDARVTRAHLAACGDIDGEEFGRTRTQRKAGARNRSRFETLSPAWQGMRRELGQDRLWYDIAPIAAWASDRKLAPCAMREETLAICMMDVMHSGYSRGTTRKQSFRRAVTLLLSRSTVAMPDVNAPSQRARPRKDQLDQLPFALRAEVEAATQFYVKRPTERRKEATIATAVNVLLRAIAVATDAGHKIISLYGLMQPDVLKDIVSNPWFGPITEANTARSQLLEMLRRLAWQRYGEEKLSELLTIYSVRFPRRRPGLSQQRVEEAQIFEDIESLSALKARCRENVVKLSGAGRASSRLLSAQTAIGVLLLIETAVQPRSLTTAHFAGPPHPGSSRPTLVTDDPHYIELETNMSQSTFHTINFFYNAFEIVTGRQPRFLFEHHDKSAPKARCVFNNGMAALKRDLDLQLLTPTAIRLGALNLVFRQADLEAKELKELTRTTRTSHFVDRFELLLNASSLGRYPLHTEQPK